MQVLKYAETPAIAVSSSVERRFIYTEELMTVIVDLKNGPAAAPDPYHSHPHQQTTYVAEGEVMFLIEGRQPCRLTSGDMVAIPSGCLHAIRLLTPTARLVDSFTPVREDFLPK